MSSSTIRLGLYWRAAALCAVLLGVQGNQICAGQELLADLNASGVGSSPRSFLVVGDSLYFVADHDRSRAGVYTWTAGDGPRLLGLFDREPSLGRAGDRVVVHGNNRLLVSDGWNLQEFWAHPDIVLGPSLGAGLVFTEGNSWYPERLYVTDGTPEGTKLLLETSWLNLAAGPGRGLKNGRLHFIAERGSGERWLWSTDGKSAGTIRLAALPEADNSVGIVRENFLFEFYDGSLKSVSLSGHIVSTLWDGGFTGGGLVLSSDSTLFFQTRDGDLAVTDGSPAGTRLIDDFPPGVELPSAPFSDHRVPYKDGMLFSASAPGTGLEPWFTTGAAGSTRPLGDLSPGPDGSDPRFLWEIGERMYFSAYSPSLGRELWVTDGTAPGTRLSADLIPGVGSSAPTSAAVVGGRLLLGASTPSTGKELYSLTPGTDQLNLEGDLYSLGTGDSSPKGFTSADGLVAFVADDGRTGTRLWTSDGTEAGTFPVPGAPPVRAPPGTTSRPVFADGELFWVARGSVWKHDPRTRDRALRSPQMASDVRGIRVRAGLIAASLDTEVVVMDAQSLETLATLTGAFPAISGDGTVYALAGGGTVHSWSRNTGHARATPAPGLAQDVRWAVAADSSYYLWTHSVREGAYVWHSDGMGTRRLTPQKVSSRRITVESFDDRLLVGTIGGAMIASGNGLSLLARVPFEGGFLVDGERAFFTTRNVQAGGLILWETDGTPEGTIEWIDLPDLDRVYLIGLYGEDMLLVASGEEGQFFLASPGGVRPIGRPVPIVFPGGFVPLNGPAPRIDAVIADRSVVFAARESRRGFEPWILHLPSPTNSQAALDPFSGLAPEVFPNPATHHVTLKAQPGATVEAYDVLGQQVGQWDVSGGEVGLDVSGWLSGVYFLRTASGRGVAATSLVVMRR